MAITKEQVLHVANLARLYITDEELEEYTRQLSDILDYANKIAELNTDDVEPMAHVAPLKNVFRDDKMQDSGLQEKILRNAPDRHENTFRVPKIIE